MYIYVCIYIYIYLYICIYVYRQVRLGKNENSEKHQEPEDKWVRFIAMMKIVTSIKEALPEGKIYYFSQAIQIYEEQKVVF